MKKIIVETTAQALSLDEDVCDETLDGRPLSLTSTVFEEMPTRSQPLKSF